MRTRSSRAAILFLIVVSFLSAVEAQTSYSIPRAVGLDRIVRRSFPKLYGREEWNRLYPEGFFPIGWSRDGKFAYYIEPVDEACGCYFAELIIQDLRTDKIVWHFKHDWEKHVDAQGAPIEDDIRKLWKRNQKMFSEKLREHRIVPARFAMLGPTFSSAGTSYTAKMVKVRRKDENDEERLQRFTLELSSSGLGRKSLYSTKYKWGDDMWAAPLDVAVAGAFKSPYENRIAVVMMMIQRGWEGPPHSVNVQIAGADLRSGFRK